MSERIMVKVDGGWTDDPVAVATSMAAMANKDKLQTKLIAELEAEIVRLREERKAVVLPGVNCHGERGEPLVDLDEVTQALTAVGVKVKEEGR